MQGDAVGGVELADFGRDLEADLAGILDRGNDVELDAEGAKFDRSAVVGSVGNREGELPAGEEAGLFAIRGENVGFGQNLHQTLRRKSFDGGAQIQVRAKEEEV